MEGMFKDLGKMILVFAGFVGIVGAGGGYAISKLTEDPMQVETITLTVDGKKSITMDQDAAIDFMEAAKKTGQDVKITGVAVKIDGQKASVPVGDAPKP